MTDQNFNLSKGPACACVVEGRQVILFVARMFDVRPTACFE